MTLQHLRFLAIFPWKSNYTFDLNSDLYRLCSSLHGLDTFWVRGLSWINKETTTTTTGRRLERTFKIYSLRNGFPFRHSRKFKIDTVESYRMTHQHLRLFAIFFSEIKLNTEKRLEIKGIVFDVYANRVFGNNVNITDFPWMSALKSAQTYLWAFINLESSRASSTIVSNFSDLA